MSTTTTQPKFLAIKNWDKYQTDMHNRGWIRDYVAKDDDPEYTTLSCFQRYVLDACCRLRGRIARNLHNDPTWLVRLLHVTPKDAPHVPHAIRTLTARGFLILTNQQLGFTEEKRGEEKRREEKNAPSAGNLFSGEPIPEVKGIIGIPLNDGTEYQVLDGRFEEWIRLYPAVDVMQELRNMRGWSLANVGRRKTIKGVEIFINKWLAKEQNNGGGRRQQGYEGNGGQRKQTPYEQAQDRIRDLQAEIECDGAEVGGGVRDSEQTSSGERRPQDVRARAVVVH